MSSTFYYFSSIDPFILSIAEKESVSRTVNVDIRISFYITNAPKLLNELAL